MIGLKRRRHHGGVDLEMLQLLSARAARFRPRRCIGEIGSAARSRGWVTPREAADVIGCPIKVVWRLYCEGLLKARVPRDFSVLQIDFDSLVCFIDRFGKGARRCG